jgi:hypothetical protein
MWWLHKALGKIAENCTSPKAQSHKLVIDVCVHANDSEQRVNV